MFEWFAWDSNVELIIIASSTHRGQPKWFGSCPSVLRYCPLCLLACLFKEGCDQRFSRHDARINIGVFPAITRCFLTAHKPNEQKKKHGRKKTMLRHTGIIPNHDCINPARGFGENKSKWTLVSKPHSTAPAWEQFRLEPNERGELINVNELVF